MERTRRFSACRVVRETVVRLASQHDGTVKRYAPQALTQALEGQPLDGNGRDSMYRAVRDLAREKVTPLTLGQMYAFGKDPGPEQRLANARFLQRELPVRLSQRAVELMNLPHGLSSMPGIQQVYNCYARYAWEILCRPAASSPSEEYDFSCFLSSILLDGQSIPRALSLGLQDFHNRLAEENEDREGVGLRRGNQCLRAMDPAVRLDVQEALSRFFTGRIGVRFLIEHHVASATQRQSRPGWSGVIQSTVSPSVEARHAAADVRSLCMTHLGAVPRIRILGEDEHTFTYVPSHLEIMLSEQLKNACRAVVEQHHPAYTSMIALAGPIHCWGERECMSVKKQALAAQGWPDGGPQIPPVKVTVTMGKNDVVIKIADEGGGASRSDIELLWTYFYTTANKHLTGRNTLPVALTGGYEPHDSGETATGEKVRREESEHGHEPVTPLAGLGVGLPLSRMYARYFGGEIILKSMEGFGMDSGMARRSGGLGEDLTF